MLAAFEGWNDAGSAASQALEHLHEVWGAEQVDELDPEEYHDFQVNRPVLGIGPDGKREIAWPTTAVAVATTSDVPHSLSRHLVTTLERSFNHRSTIRR